jgi:hypothetical protein
MPGRYIVVWRRSATARYLDVQVEPGGETIAVIDELPADHEPVIDEEDDLIAYIGSNETESRYVDADLAHRVLGWTIPSSR